MDGGFGVYHAASPYGPPPTPSRRSNSNAGEAFLLSQATSTAMVAARSILMSGGSEETALRTAKAAAQSVLNPGFSDNDTISGKSSTFLRRRKAKRQAEVVASMALMSATSNVRSGVSCDWDALTNSTDHQSQSHSHSHSQRQMMQYQQGVPFNGFSHHNIMTRSTQDDPSVLSGSVRASTTGSVKTATNSRPPIAPAPAPKSEPAPKAKAKPEPAPKAKAKPEPAPKAKAKPEPAPKAKAAKPPVEEPKTEFFRAATQAKRENAPTPPPPIQIPPALTQPPQKKERGRPISSIIDRIQSRRKMLASPKQDEDPIYYSMSEDFNPNPTLSLEAPSSSTSGPGGEGEGEDESVDSIISSSEVKRQQKNGKTSGKEFMAKHIDPVLFSFTNAFNAFTCGPLTAFVAGSNDEPKFKSGRRDRRQKTDRAAHAESRDDVDMKSMQDDYTDADETDAEDYEKKNSMRDDMDSFDHSDMRHMSASQSSCSESSVDSKQLHEELNSSSSEEGEIQVRSTIRETMEKVVSKSKKPSLSDISDIDRTWLSYELRQDDGPEQIVSTVQVVASKKPKQPVQAITEKGKNSWFRSKGRRQKSS